MNTQKSFEQFVLDNKDILRESFTYVRYINKTTLQGSKIEKEICVNHKPIQKWFRLLDDFF